MRRCITNRSAASYAAFCRKYGDHETPAVGSHNWNEEAMESMISDLETPWQNLLSTLQNRHRRTALLIENLIGWAVQYLSKS